MKIGVIGGSGLDDPNILHNASDVKVTTAYGVPSSLKTGTIEDIPVMLEDEARQMPADEEIE